jgi:hypothetical protein
VQTAYVNLDILFLYEVIDAEDRYSHVFIARSDCKFVGGKAELAGDPFDLGSLLAGRAGRTILPISAKQDVDILLALTAAATLPILPFSLRKLLLIIIPHRGVT